MHKMYSYDNRLPYLRKSRTSKMLDLANLLPECWHLAGIQEYAGVPAKLLTERYSCGVESKSFIVKGYDWWHLRRAGGDGSVGR